ncbi:MAG: hypothetical protein RBS55_08290 [Bacteroidales bacterium]|jgi:hypothetical protein|nr:hypothetical protein [Bacteroidales bacterium]
MKTLFLIPAALLLVIMGMNQSIAQNCDPYYVVDEGAVREMASYDKKDKLTGTSIQTVKEIKSSGNRTEWTIGNISKDAKGKELSSGDLYMSCEEGIFKMDMKNFLDEETMKGFEGMEVTVDATDLDYPASLAPGQTLNDGTITVKVSSQGMPIMTLVVKIYDRKVEAVEDVNTPAGTFSCYKMTQAIETKTMFTATVKSTDWIAKKVGTVRSETYDKNGNLQGYSLLTSVK